LLKTLIVFCIASSAFSASIYAHHGVPSGTETNPEVLITGNVEIVEWTNPHVRIHLKANNAQGLEQRWTVIADAPRELLSRGLSRSLLDVMGTVQLLAYPSGAQPCSIDCIGFGYNLVDSHGRTFILHQELHEVVNQLIFNK